jgi:glycosyltransferase involved in cell wall biosynthesis
LHGRRILWIAAEDWFFRLHYLDLVRALTAAGAEVHLAARLGRRGPAARATVEAAGITVHPLRSLDRTGLNPWTDLAAVRELTGLCRTLAPDLVQTLAIKPVIYGTLAARRAGIAARCAWMPGMGHAFTATSLRARLLRRVVSGLPRSALGDGGTRCMVLNGADREVMARIAGLPADRVEVMPGTGVDLARFPAHPPPDGPPKAVFTGRMIAEKGLVDLVEAARLLAAEGRSVPIELVGAPDPENRTTVSEAQLQAWSAEGLVTWRGPTDDVAGVWREAAIAVLPSYREGLSVSLLEAASCARPAVATDVPGSREAVVDGETGLLVPARDPRALADALARLAADPATRAAMGRRARARVERHFALPAVQRRLIALYADVLATARAMPR